MGFHNLGSPALKPAVPQEGRRMPPNKYETAANCLPRSPPNYTESPGTMLTLSTPTRAVGLLISPLLL